MGVTLLSIDVLPVVSAASPISIPACTCCSRSWRTSSSSSSRFLLAIICASWVTKVSLNLEGV